MRYKHYLCLIQAGCFVLLFSACASKTASMPTGLVGGLAPPPVQSSLNTEYELIRSALPQRPDWIDNPPAAQGDIHYLVGLSLHHATERSAREDAMRHARKEFAAYTGVDVKDVDKVMKALYGLSSQVMDATVSKISQSSQTTDAHVSRIKAKQWFWESYRIKQNGQASGSAYKYWVLVTIPKDEYDRVQQWKQQQRASRQATLIAHQAEVDRYVKAILDSHQQTLQRVEQSLQSGQVMLALQRLSASWSQLYDAQKDLQDKGPAYQAKQPLIKSVQQQIPHQFSEIQKNIVLDLGRFKTHGVIQGSELKIPAWVWYRNADVLIAIEQFPLQVIAPSGKIMTTGKSDKHGTINFFVRQAQAGQYVVKINLQDSSAKGLDSAVKAMLAKTEAPFAVTPFDASLSNVAAVAVAALFAGAEYQPLPVRKVVIGRIINEQTARGGQFSVALSRALNNQLLIVSGLTVVQPKRRTTQSLTAAKKRGITLTGRNKLDMGSDAMQAVIDHADASLSAEYRVVDDAVAIYFSLKQAASNVLLSATTASVHKDLLAEHLQNDLMQKPVALVAVDQLTSASTAQQANAIDLEITSELGDGQTYVEGDVISYFVSSSHDAFLLLIYQDASGNLIQILPNQYSANHIYSADLYFQVPGENVGFQFEIAAPFGDEHVWAFASTGKFSDLPGQVLDNGLKLLSDAMPDIVQRLRRIDKQQQAYGEAKTTITTVAKLP